MKLNALFASIAASLLLSATAYASTPALAGSAHSPAHTARSTSPKSQQSSKSANAGKNPGSQQTNEQQATELSAITVTGVLGSELRAEATKRNAVGVVDSVSAEEAGKFPDLTVAGALQRVPGVSVNRAGGQPNQITVRGFGPNFVNVLLNGNRVASATFSRAFNFDILPVQLLQRAVVHKTSTANLPSGGIGATINVVTWEPLEFSGFHVEGSVQGARDSVDGSTQKITPRVSALIGDTNADGTFGWLVAASYYKRDHREDNVGTGGWPFSPAPLVNPNKSIYMPQTLQGNVVLSKQQRQALDGAVTWRPMDRLTLKFNGLVTQYKVDNPTNAFGLFAQPGAIQSIKTDPNDTALHFVENDLGALSDDQILSDYPSNQKSWLAGFHVNYRVGDGTTVGFDSSASRAWDKDADNGYDLVLGTRNIGLNPTWTNNGTDMPSYTNVLPPTLVNDLHLHYDVRNGTNVSDGLMENKLHLTHEFESGVLDKVQFGISSTTETKKKVSYNIPGLFSCAGYCGYVAKAPASAIGAHVEHFGKLVGGVSPTFPTEWVTYDAAKVFAYMASPAAYDQLSPAARAIIVNGLASNHGGFNAVPNPQGFARIHEIDNAAYGMGTLSGDMGSMPWKLNVGLRYTQTHITSAAYSVPLLKIRHSPIDPTLLLPVFGQLSPISSSGKYHFWLPSLNFRLNVLPNVVVRAAYSKTLTRPDLTSLSSAVSYDFHPTNQTANTGNPKLKPYLSKNYDLGVEWYFSHAGYVSLDGFSKRVSNFTTTITSVEQILGNTFQVTRPINLNNATVKGVEATFNDHFSWLPEPFNGLGVALNYTYVDSGSSIGPAELTSTSRFGIPGIGNSYNASLYYQNHKFQVRVAYNWRQAYLASISGAGGLPVTVKAFGQVDADFSYQLTKNVAIFGDAQNLNNEHLYQYEVFPNRPLLAEADGRTFLLGVRASFH